MRGNSLPPASRHLAGCHVASIAAAYHAHLIRENPRPSAASLLRKNSTLNSAKSRVPLASDQSRVSGPQEHLFSVPIENEPFTEQGDSPF